MKTIIKLLFAALVIHATFKAGMVYMRYYEFKDDVTQVAQFGTNQTDNHLRSGVIDAATWQALQAGGATPLARYVVSEADLRGPFQPVPKDIMERAKTNPRAHPH